MVQRKTARKIAKDVNSFLQVQVTNKKAKIDFTNTVNFRFHILKLHNRQIDLLHRFSTRENYAGFFLLDISTRDLSLSQVHHIDLKIMHTNSLSKIKQENLLFSWCNLVCHRFMKTRLQLKGLLVFCLHIVERQISGLHRDKKQFFLGNNN